MAQKYSALTMIPSVQDLETQISQICQDIEQQKQVLRILERNKSRLERQLNGIRDPIARLPSEISSEIFLHCRPSSPESGIKQMPIILLNVCNTWTDIALSTTALWTAIRDVFPCSKGFRDVLEGWFQRARNHLLDLRVDVLGASNESVAALIRRQCAQLSRLDVRFENQLDPDDLIFRDTDCEALPFLQTLSIASRDGVEVSWTPILQLLCRSPNLTDLSLQDLHLVDTLTPGEEMEPIIFPNLRRFILTMNPLEPNNDDVIFQSVCAPRLENLILHNMHFQSTAEFIPFSTLSATGLQELAFDCLHITEPLDPMDDFLSLVPSLTRLKISSPLPAVVQRLASLLIKEALPNLQFLELTFVDDDLSFNSPWTVLLPVLFIRYERFESLRITTYRRGVEELDPRLLATLRGLSSAGIDIWVGTAEKNLFVA